MQAHGIAPIDLLVCNLYPFEATIAAGAADEECIENIDIGGPALIRAAAKNHSHVAVLVDPAQYAALLGSLPPRRHYHSTAPPVRRRRLRPHRRLRFGHRHLVRRSRADRIPHPHHRRRHAPSDPALW